MFWWFPSSEISPLWDFLASDIFHLWDSSHKNNAEAFKELLWLASYFSLAWIKEILVNGNNNNNYNYYEYYRLIDKVIIIYAYWQQTEFLYNAVLSLLVTTQIKHYNVCVKH